MDKYLNDNRMPCKYGENCYQKNLQHHKRFKHPPKEKKESDFPAKKKLKVETEGLNNSEENQNEVKNEETDLHVMFNEQVTEDGINEDENDIPPKSPSSIEENIKQKFLVDMPRDFYDFWNFCKTLNGNNPEEAFKICGFKLVGAFDILNNNLKTNKCIKLSKFLCHWRFYYDPPEFQTVIVGDKDEYHIGYFRDDPSEDPIFLASMSSIKPGVIQPLKEDLFSTIFQYIKSSEKVNKSEKNNLLQAIKDFADDKGYKLDCDSYRLKKRNKKIVSKAFHGAGIVVPVNNKTNVGYREIPETNASLKKILKNIVEAETEEKKIKCLDVLQELMTNAQWATDEGDFGMGLELGLDLFTYGGEVFHSFICHLLTVAYDLLHRRAFSKIIQAHLKDRRKGPNMSSFDKEV